MKLDKAIEILDDCTKGALLGISEDTKDAIKLGIEALKEVKHTRSISVGLVNPKLPGEDPEDAPTRSLHHIKAVLESPLGKEPKG